MIAAAKIRAEIEAALALKVPRALTPAPREIRPVSPTGIVAVDELLHGGFPIGAITEIIGSECSGRTSLSFAFLASLGRQGKVCAWVDTSDSLHPESAAAAGIDLEKMLWIRCGAGPRESAAYIADQPACTENQQVCESSKTRQVHLGGNSPHPRNEAKGLPVAVADLLNRKPVKHRNRTVGTPGVPNRALSSPPTGPVQVDKKEQTATDRLPPRRGTYVLEQRKAYEPACSETQPKLRPNKDTQMPQSLPIAQASSPIAARMSHWQRMDQALRVTDLLLQAGGFSAIVLDMGSMAAEYALRVPLATWFRYRAAAERTQSSFILLTQHSCAKSSAGLVLRFDAADPVTAGQTVFGGLIHHVELARCRFEQERDKIISIRKQPQRADGARWRSQTSWVGQR